ncbi:DUF2992 family protein [Streptomyces caatingaensis]|uniref:DUF2992 domain-containing protein n=1 Tax=Streptomyces caatingaensis TaxID=1678637 RepID=A0A0K9XKN8_9ACTN|nr:DUF2992 family protein [Streptomyces caatingaensis]KNB53868.1 hypothetical protein AC230_04585 [Streptomyces caatingaensis]
MPSTFSVFFEGPFWVGVLEIAGPDGVRAARHVFGGEPTGAELAEFTRRDFDALLARALAAPAVPADACPPPARRAGAKRAARAAAREQAARPVTTGAQEALREAFEETAHLNRAAAKRQRAAEAEQRRALARAKAKARHRGK